MYVWTFSEGRSRRRPSLKIKKTGPSPGFFFLLHLLKNTNGAVIGHIQYILLISIDNRDIIAHTIFCMVELDGFGDIKIFVLFIDAHDIAEGQIIYRYFAAGADVITLTIEECLQLHVIPG